MPTAAAVGAAAVEPDAGGPSGAAGPSGAPSSAAVPAASGVYVAYFLSLVVQGSGPTCQLPRAAAEEIWRRAHAELKDKQGRFLFVIWTAADGVPPGVYCYEFSVNGVANMHFVLIMDAGVAKAHATDTGSSDDWAPFKR